VSAWQLRGTRYSSPFHGVHRLGDSSALIDRCRAALVVIQMPMVFSHQTVALLLGLPVPRAPRGRDAIHVTVLPGRTAPRHQRMVGHVRAFTLADVGMHLGLPVTTAARLFVDMAATLPRPALVAIGDAILRGGHATVAELQAALQRRVGGRGVRRALDLLAFLSAAAESPMESILRLLLLDAGLPSPEVNVDICDALGRFLARADLLFRAAKVIVEYDGDQHRTDRVQFARDVRRGSELAASGYLVLRFTASDVLNRPAYVIATVRAALASRGR
jgi:very-short-patch-repair endonuclease